jgi:hypothetical protein
MSSLYISDTVKVFTDLSKATACGAIAGLTYGHLFNANRTLVIKFFVARSLVNLIFTKLSNAFLAVNGKRGLNKKLLVVAIAGLAFDTTTSVAMQRLGLIERAGTPVLGLLAGANFYLRFKNYKV